MPNFSEFLQSLLMGVGGEQSAQAAPGPQGGQVPPPQMLPVRNPPRPTPRPSLPGGSFAPNRQTMPPTAPIPTPRPAGPVPGGEPQPQQRVNPLMALLAGGGAGGDWRQMVRAAGSGMANLRNTGGDPFMSFGQGFGGATGHYDDKQREEIAAAAQRRKDQLEARRLEIQQRGGATKYGLTPVWGTDPETGKPTLGVLGNDGTFKKVDTAGFDISTGVEKVDLGDRIGFRDKRSGQIVGYEMKGGDPSADQRPSADGGLEPIPGSKLDLEVGAMKSKALSSMEALESQHAIVEDNLSRAIEQVEANPNLMAGLGGNLLSAVPGTPAYDLAEKLKTIKANVGFDRLQAMRDASPTGGALGQVTERELAFLQATIGSLEQAQSAEELVYNMKRLQEFLANSKNARLQAFASDFGEGVPSDVSPEAPALSDGGEAPDLRPSDDGWTDFGNGIRLRKMD